MPSVGAVGGLRAVKCRCEGKDDPIHQDPVGGRCQGAERDVK